MSDNSGWTVGRITQISRAHESARPKQSNPAWVNTHHDLGVALEEIKRLSTEGALMREALEYYAAMDNHTAGENMIGGNLVQELSSMQWDLGEKARAALASVSGTQK